MSDSMVMLWCLVAAISFILLCCLGFFMIKLLLVPFEVLATVKRIRRENESLKAADAKCWAARDAGDEPALESAVFEWAQVSGLIDAADARNDRRVRCSNYVSGGPQQQPWPGELEDVAAYFRYFEVRRQDLIFWIIKKFNLAKKEKPTWV